MCRGERRDPGTLLRAAEYGRLSFRAEQQRGFRVNEVSCADIRLLATRTGTRTGGRRPMLGGVQTEWDSSFPREENRGGNPKETQG